MGDNIRLIYNLIHYLNYNNLPGLLICIDLEKAFDSLDWNFVMKVLKAFGFGPIICQWVYTFCVQAVKKYIKGLDIAVQSNKSLNMRKSLTLIANQSAALNGTAYSLTILTGLQPFTKLF